MQDRILTGFVGFRTRWRGILLPAFALPFLPAAVLAAAAGDQRMVAGAALAIGLPFLAATRLRRGRRGDLRRAALLMAGAAAAGATLGAGLGPILGVMAGFAGFFGTRMLYAELPETAPPPPPAPPGPLDQARIRIAAVAAAAAALPSPGLARAAGAIRAMVDELAARPERLPLARRFLAVNLDGIERIATRLAAGAAPPERLPQLLDDLTTAATELRGRLQREETTALEVQVKVLSDRLREEGY